MTLVAEVVLEAEHYWADARDAAVVAAVADVEAIEAAVEAYFETATRGHVEVVEERQSHVEQQ